MQANNNNSTPSSSVWHRRTNRLIAACIIVIGLTMMISNIAQCIYIGMLFIVLALIWLARLTVNERKREPTRPEDQPSPVLFLVSPHMLPRSNRPTIANPNDKPPSYDQIVSLDGLPPDYHSALTEKPPRYEDLTVVCDVHGTPSSNDAGPSPYSNNNAAGSGSNSVDSKDIPVRRDRKTDTFFRNGPNSSSFSLPRSHTPVVNFNRKRNKSSSSSGGSSINGIGGIASNFLRLQVPTLPQDIAGRLSRYLETELRRSSNSLQNSKRYSESTRKDYSTVDMDLGKTLSEANWSRSSMSDGGHSGSSNKGANNSSECETNCDKTKNEDRNVDALTSAAQTPNLNRIPPI